MKKMSYQSSRIVLILEPLDVLGVAGLITMTYGMMQGMHHLMHHTVFKWLGASNADKSLLIPMNNIITGSFVYLFAYLVIKK